MTSICQYDPPQSTLQEAYDPSPDLNVARRLAEAGVPIFIAYPSDDPKHKTGFTPPVGWPRTKPDPSVVDLWRPGLALCAVTGHGLDLIDIDPRNGGVWPDDVVMPRVYASAATPSGGTHHFIASLGVRSRDNVFPGVDIKAGDADGGLDGGWGFAFVCPTVRASKVDGVARAYRWVQEPDFSTGDLDNDDSGRPLADRINASRRPRGPKVKGGPDWWGDFLDNKAPQSDEAADRAVQEKLREVKDWAADSGAGFRHTLMRAAMTLGGYVGGGWLDLGDAREMLEAACDEQWGQADDDDRLWIEQGLTDGAAQPFYVYTLEDDEEHGGSHEREGEEKKPPRKLPPPSAPLAVARKLIVLFTLIGLLTLRRWRGDWMHWTGTHWRALEDTEVRGWFYVATEHAVCDKTTRDVTQEVAWAPNARKISDVLDAVKAIVYLPASVEAQTWLEGSGDGARAGPLVACRNGLLVVRGRDLIEHSPAYFNLVSVPFDYQPSAPTPARWLRFLDQVFNKDRESIDALQEWFGYVLSGRTDLHKVLLLIGPPRSGKGTIVRVLTAMVGAGNVAGPTLASFGANFGLSPLVGKPLAVVADARMGNRDNVTRVVETILSISGEDRLTLDRKYKDPYTGSLPTRLMIVSNELPRFGDSSGAIASRFVVLRTPLSFLGKEDTALGDRLMAELPGILNWALDGLERLDARGQFVSPAASADDVAELAELVSPVKAFVNERCVVGDSGHARCQALYEAWKHWAANNGHPISSLGTFGKDLHAAVPSVKTRRPKGAPREYVGISLASRVGDTPPQTTLYPTQFPLGYCPSPN